MMAGNSPPASAVSRRQALAAVAAATGYLVLPLPAGANSGPAIAAKKTSMDIDRFVQDCVVASQGNDPQAAVLEVLAKTVESPRAVLAALGEPQEAGITVLHRSKTLTIFNAAWTPQMNLMPHNHLMWANIGIYTGREDNLLWRRTPRRIEAYGAKALFEGDVVALPVDVIHSVTNPLLRFTGGIHVYGGDFFDTTRSQWNPETLKEEPSDGAAIREMFQRENERMHRKGPL
jgi:predicted metal-dependent enzyme (double-stranded beta helix superfamily)